MTVKGLVCALSGILDRFVFYFDFEAQNVTSSQFVPPFFNLLVWREACKTLRASASLQSTYNNQHTTSWADLPATDKQNKNPALALLRVHQQAEISNDYDGQGMAPSIGH